MLCLAIRLNRPLSACVYIKKHIAAHLEAMFDEVADKVMDKEGGVSDAIAFLSLLYVNKVELFERVAIHPQ